MPAVWSDSAQAKTRACAEAAGMGKNLQIISEPEAAAIYALHAMDPHSIQVGDTFVLCDAGGGTVDLISYTVTELKPILKVTEAAMGSGRLCGSTFLNRIFQKYLVDKLSLNEEWDEEVVEDAMKRFDLVTKKSFRGAPNEEFVIPGKFPINIFSMVLTSMKSLVWPMILPREYGAGSSRLLGLKSRRFSIP